MPRRLLAIATTALLLIGISALTLSAGAAVDDVVPTKVIMKKLNAGPKSALARVKKELGNSKIDWKSIQADAKEFATLAPNLPKNEPPKGDKASWDKLTAGYAEAAAALAAGAEKEDEKATKDAVGTLGGSCMPCHKEHKK